jgi:SPP1 family predicted phage head-tail adaptor
MIRAGKLRHVITYQSKTQSLDEYGGPVETWATFATVRAAVSPLIGKDMIASMASQSTAEARVNHRFVTGITSAMRILWDGVAYEVVGEPANVHGLSREHEVYIRKVGGGA